MIELKLSGKCAGCPALSPVFSEFIADELGAEVTVWCQNQRLCDHLEARLAEAYEAQLVRGAAP